MENSISIDYINTAIDELIKLFGIRDDIDSNQLLKLLQERKIKQCIDNIAIFLGLPVKIDLVYVPASYACRTAADNSFESSEIVKTDSKRVGSEGIVAQVAIPSYIPPYGSNSLRGFQIKVKVSENCVKYPESFIAVISHELSHILLATVSSKQAHNEFYTDLTPMILGFTRILRDGRKTTEVTNSFYGAYTETTTHTTQYGYLDNNQFMFAQRKINRLLKTKRLLKKGLIVNIHCFNKQYKNYTKYLRLFKKAVQYFKLMKNVEIKPSEGSLIASFFNPEFLNELSSSHKKNEERLEKLNGYYDNFSHYTQYNESILVKNTENAKNFSHDLDLKIGELKKYVDILVQYLSLLDKIKIKICYLLT